MAKKPTSRIGNRGMREGGMAVIRKPKKKRKWVGKLTPEQRAARKEWRAPKPKDDTKKNKSKASGAKKKKGGGTSRVVMKK